MVAERIWAPIHCVPAPAKYILSFTALAALPDTPEFIQAAGTRIAIRRHNAATGCAWVFEADGLYKVEFNFCARK